MVLRRSDFRSNAPAALGGLSQGLARGQQLGLERAQAMQNMSLKREQDARAMQMDQARIQSLEAKTGLEAQKFEQDSIKAKQLEEKRQLMIAATNGDNDAMRRLAPTDRKTVAELHKSILDNKKEGFSLDNAQKVEETKRYVQEQRMAMGNPEKMDAVIDKYKHLAPIAQISNLKGKEKDAAIMSSLYIGENILAVDANERKEKELQQKMDKETKSDELKQQKLTQEQQKYKAQQIEARQKIETEVASAQGNIDAINELQGDTDSIKILTDSYGATAYGSTGSETLLKSTQKGQRAFAQLSRIKDTLTMQNLSKMSGTKTDKDIELLANAASSLRVNMSSDDMNEKLEGIKKVYNRVLRHYGEQQEALGYVPESKPQQTEQPAAQPAQPMPNLTPQQKSLSDSILADLMAGK